MKRIGIDARFYGVAGPGRYVSELLASLMPKLDGYDVYLLVMEDKKESVAKLFPKAHVIGTQIYWYSAKEQFALPRLLNSLKLDLIHFPHFNVPYFYRRPYVVTIHDLIIHRYPTYKDGLLSRIFYTFKHVLYKQMIRHTIKRAKAVLVPSNEVKADLERYYGSILPPTTVTYEGVTPFKKQGRRVERLVQFGVKQPYILYVGSMYPHKNILRLLEAYQLLYQKNPQVPTLVLLGKYDYFAKKMAQRVHLLGLDGAVVFPSSSDKTYLSDDDLAAFYEYASLFVFPSLQEGFGLPPLEAMQMGVPVVASNSSCLPEILGEAAVYFDPENTAQMAQIIENILPDKKLQKQQIERGYLWVKRYSWDKMAKQTLSVYDQAMGKMGS